MVSRFEYHGKESLMEKRRQRRKEQLRNRTVALAAGLLLAGVCGVSSALAATGGASGFDAADAPQDTTSLSAAPSSLAPAEGGSDASLKEIANWGANLLAVRSGDQKAVEGMQIETALIRAEGAKDQTLTDGSSFSVDFSKQFTLHVVVKSQLNLEGKKLEIVVPDGLTVVEYPIPERGGMAESVTPESIGELRSANNYGGYRPTNGTITYSLKSTAEENSFNIILEPDTTLWNRKKEQTLTNPLTIRAYTDDADGQKDRQTISVTPKIIGSYDASRAIQTGPRLSGVGVKDGVPTAANQPFALRQIWLNPDKDYIDMPQFFKKLEITIALPYYEKDGNKIYAEFDHVSYDPVGQSTRPNMMDPKNHKDGGSGYKDSFGFNETEDAVNHTVTLTWENLYLEYAQEYFTPYFKWTTDCGNTSSKAIKWGSDSIKNTGNTAPGCYEGKTPDSGNASAVGGLITWNDGTTWYPWNNHFNALSFTAYAGEYVTVNGASHPKGIYNAYDSDPDIVYYLGQFHVVNQGGANSVPKTVEFSYNKDKDGASSGKIGVTAQKIPANAGNDVTVWYTTNKSGERKYDSVLKSEGGFATFTSQMANLVEGEYFTKIKANVGSYERDYVGYVASRSADPTSGYATTFGKLLSGDVNDFGSFASMTMYDTPSDENAASRLNEVTGTYNVSINKKLAPGSGEKEIGEIPLAMEQAYEQGTLNRVPILSDSKTGEGKTSATAGDTITFNGLLSSSGYPYSNNNIITDPVIYIRLPEKITVDRVELYSEVGRKADKVFLFDAVTETVKSPIRTGISAYKFEEISSAADGAMATGYKLYKITFTDTNNPVKVGWFGPDLGQYQIGISFDMTIAKDADAMTLDMRDCVRFKSRSLKSTSNTGTLAQYQVKDAYDMDGDGDLAELISTFNVNAVGTKLSVVAARLGLTFTFGAKMTDKGSEEDFEPTHYSNYEVDGKKVYLKDNAHVVHMLFTLKNDTGREFNEDDAKAFYYFIPVPKQGAFWDNHMQDQSFEFDMNLTRAPSLSGISKGNILVTYATDIDPKAASGTDKHYSNKAQYKTENELLNGCSTDAERAEAWAKVKMIRIAAKDDVKKIDKNADLRVDMRLEPTFSSNADLVGSVVNFGPCGVSPYSVGNTLNQGHNPLPRIQVEFQTGVIEGKIFIDKNFDGVYTEGIDELYKDNVEVKAPHQNSVGADEGDGETHATTAKDGTFKFTGRRADAYHVIVANPGSTDANSDNPLKFSLPESGEGGGFTLGTDPATATATVTLAKGNGTANLAIGLQRPHNVSFSATNATLSTETAKVWHNEKLGDGIPTVEADSGWKFTGNWTDGANTYTTDQLKEQAIDTNGKIFTAEVKQLYSVTYDGNDNTAGNIPETTWHIEGEGVVPVHENSLNRGEKTIFVGWSLEKVEDVLQANATEDVIKKVISADEHKMPPWNVTLYAVYAVDDNGNGKPDYNDDAVHVRYHGNNNVRTDYLCPHHHVVGATAELSTSGTISGRSLSHDGLASSAAGEVTKHTFTYGTNIFIGWSTTPILGQVITTKAEYDALAGSIVKEVKMLQKPGADVPENDAKDTSKYADADGNTNVYAVWAADRNGNAKADYAEERKLTYDSNSQRDGTVTGGPSEKTTGDNGEPIISGDTVSLGDAKPKHSEVDGKSVAFIGWTTTRTSSIYGRDVEAPPTVTEVTFGAVDKTVYAAWGYDENNDGTADVLETYSLTYDLNGGNETPPAQVKNIAKGATVDLTTEAKFSRHPNELFVGWSTTKHQEAFTAAQKDALKETLITGTSVIFGAADKTLYAVWAQDRNSNQEADYLETQYELNYDGNVQSGGSVSGLPSDNDIHLAGETAPLSKDKPSHSSADGKKVVFLGWTEQQPVKILSRSDDEPSLVEEVTFTDANKTVYAAWGYDENGDGVADVAETYTLSYDLNGGTGTAPASQTGIKKGAPVSLAPDTGFTRPPKNPGNITEIFAGWSRAKHEDAFTAEQRDEAKKALVSGQITMGTENLTLYAVWAQDRNNNTEPDFSEKTYKIIYDGNAQENGTVKGLPADKGLHLTGDTVSLGSGPTHSGLNGKEVVFLGWTLSRVDGIFDHEAAPTSADEGMTRDGAASHAYVNSVELVDADVTVYAAWGYQEHVWGDWAVETPPTCAQQGTEKRTCTTCDAVERRSLDVLPHEWEANFTVDKPVTCVEDGLKSNHCKHCGATRYATPIPSVGHVLGGWKADAAGHWRECTVCNVKAAAGAHEFREVMANDGHRREVCSVCGYDRERQAILPATDGASAPGSGVDGSGWFQTLVRLPQTGDLRGLWVVILLATAILGASVSAVAFRYVRRLVRGRHAK